MKVNVTHTETKEIEVDVSREELHKIIHECDASLVSPVLLLDKLYMSFAASQCNNPKASYTHSGHFYDTETTKDIRAATKLEKEFYDKLNEWRELVFLGRLS